MKRTSIFTAIALTFGLSLPVWANSSEAEPAANANASGDAGAAALDVRGHAAAAIQQGDVLGNDHAAEDLGLSLSGSNAATGAFNGGNGVSGNAQNSGPQSLMQQKTAVQSAEKAPAGAVASANDDSAAWAASLGTNENKADQSGYSSDNSVGAGLGLLMSGDNTVGGAFNSWNGVTQNAQNSGVQALMQQNIGVQAGQGSDTGAGASAGEMSSASAIGREAWQNAATQQVETLFNSLAADNGAITSGDNGVDGAFQGWAGAAQNAQNTGAQSALQQNQAVQANGDAAAHSEASADDASSASARSVDEATNTADQYGQVVFGSQSAYDGSIASGDNSMSDAFKSWSGLSQSAQNAGAQSSSQQNLALQASGGAGGGASASAFDASAAQAQHSDTARNTANQSGFTDSNFMMLGNGDIGAGNNTVEDAFKSWKGISQNMQNTGAHSNNKQNIGVQASGGHVHSRAFVRSNGGSGAYASSADVSENEASQSAGSAGNALSADGGTASAGDNLAADAFKSWQGLSQHGQQAGTQSYLNQNLAVQADAGNENEGAYVYSSNGANGEAMRIATKTNTAAQNGDIVSSGAYVTDGGLATGDNLLSDAFRGWSGISQSAQGSGAQNGIEQNMAVQAHGGQTKGGASVLAIAGAEGRAVDLDLRANSATQEGQVGANAVAVSAGSDSNGGSNAVNAGSFSGWNGLSQNAQNSGAQSLTQQNLAVQAHGQSSRDGAKAAADGGAEAVAKSIDFAENNASQLGSAGGNMLDLTASAMSTGGNALNGSFNWWSGVSQNAQNSGAQSLVQQNAALQVSEGEGDSGAKAGASDFAVAKAIDAELDRNRAVQDAELTDNDLVVAGLATLRSGDNAMTQSFNNWSGVSQSAQNAGVQSLVQQNMGIQANVK